MGGIIKSKENIRFPRTKKRKYILFHVVEAKDLGPPPLTAN